MRKFIVLPFVLFIVFHANAQDDTINYTSDYAFIMQDSPTQLFTMRQFNQSYLSGFRLLSKGLYSSINNDLVSDYIQMGLEAFFLMPLTHEEGHRSILTVNNIGSVSQPYFNEQGAAYVKGVTDEALRNLRDQDLPTYIRLHSGGLESDYMLARRMERLGSFQQDEFRHYKWDYWARKLGILQYYVSGLFQYEIDIKEEENELDRDIVGFDTYGAARHLHRPDMPFYRYTRYDELTRQEKNFVKRMGYRSFLNLLNPLIIGNENFQLSETLKFNIGMGYTMAPFGDFMDETVWLKYKSLNIEFYLRQFQNKENWFHGSGLSLVDFAFTKKLYATISGHFWEQPEDFDFHTSEHFVGGAIDLDFSYFFLTKNDIRLKAYSLDVGMIYKTEGFLPGELYLKDHFGMRIGTTIRL
mgnify:CR=1 FL=1